MKGLSLIQPVDPAQLGKDTLRIYEICDGCRRCFNLCPSFNTLLDGIDRHDGHVEKVMSAEHERVVDECYYCKLCYNHCPYTPPHQYALDFPKLMVLWKQRYAAERGVRWRDWLLIQTDVEERAETYERVVATEPRLVPVDATAKRRKKPSLANLIAQADAAMAELRRVR